MPRRKKTSQPTAETVLSDCYQLSLPELKLVRDALLALIECLEEEDLTEVEKKAVTKAQGLGKRGSRGYIEKKIINGCGPYLYLRLKRGETHHSGSNAKK